MINIFKFFAKDRLLINLLFYGVLIAGLINSGNLRREYLPSTEIDRMVIAIAYPGASAEDAELNAVIPIEEELKNIEGIKEYNSIALDNSAKIIVDIDQDLSDAVKDSVKDEVFRKVNKSSIRDISSDVESIQVVSVNPKLKAIFKFSITPLNENISESELYASADRIEELLKRVDGVSSVDKSGYRDREIYVNTNPQRLEREHVSLREIINSIELRNVRSTGGTLQSLQNEEQIITIGELQSVGEVGEVIVRSGFEQRKLRISDIASLEDGFEQEFIRVRVNGKKAVTFNVKKKEKADIDETVQGIKKFLEENKHLYADKFAVEVVSDESVTVNSLISVVVNNAILGFFLVILLLKVFLDFKTSLWTAMGLPFTLFGLFLYLKITGISLNVLSLGALITVLGMLVDDAIVVAESIFEKRNQGHSPIDAAVEGLKEVIAPVTVSILTTIVAFLPILTVSGSMGKFIQIYPIIITVALVISLVEAFFILPNHLIEGKEKPKDSPLNGPTQKNKIRKEAGQWFKPIARGYENFLRQALRFRYVTVLFFFLAFVATIFLSRDTLRKFVLLWDNSAETVHINLSAPPGSSLDYTERLVQKAEKIILESVPQTERVSLSSTIGKHNSRAVSLEGNHENQATVTLHLVPITERKRSAEEVIQVLRTKIEPQKINGLEEVVMTISKMGPQVGEPIDVKIVGDNDEESISASEEIKIFLAKVPGVYDIEDDQKAGKDEVVLDFDYGAMAQYSVTVESVAQTIKAAYSGVTAGSLRQYAEQSDITVRLDPAHQTSKRDLLNLLVPNQQGQLIPLRAFTSLKKVQGKASLYHHDGRRSISVTAQVDTEVTTPAQVTRKLKNEIKENRKKNSSVEFIFGGESKATAESLADLSKAFFTALVLIYFIIILQFRSLTQPLLVMTVIPLGLIGVLLALNLHGMPLSFMALIGVIGLSGVVVNDSILMINFINLVVRNSSSSTGEGLFAQIASGAGRRLRPVILTTVTTVAGLLPTVYGIGGNAQILMPTVLVMSYGILFATFLTLFFLPSLYLVHHETGAFFKNSIQSLRRTRWLSKFRYLSVTAETTAKPETHPGILPDKKKRKSEK